MMEKRSTGECIRLPEFESQVVWRRLMLASIHLLISQMHQICIVSMERSPFCSRHLAEGVSVCLASP